MTAVARVTTRAWFGPKKYLGWGWAPQAWQGWVTTAVFLVLAIADMSLISGTGRYVGLVVVLVAFAVVLVLTGDPPGGPSHS